MASNITIWYLVNGNNEAHRNSLCKIGMVIGSLLSKRAFNLPFQLYGLPKIHKPNIRIASTSLASLRTGVVRSNLISIPLRAPPEFVYRRQFCNFALVSARSIRNKTLMLNDFIVEHDVDIFAITATWLCDSDFDDFFCSDICPAGYNFFHYPRTTSLGGVVAVLTKKPFKVVKQQLANFKSFEAYEAVLKSSASIHVQYCQLDSIGKNRSSIRPICSIWRIENFLDDPTSRVFYLPFASH